MCFWVMYMYPCSRMLWSSQHAYSEMTSSTSSNSKICCILCASVTGTLLLASPAELPCLLFRPEFRPFSTCISSPATTLFLSLIFGGGSLGGVGRSSGDGFGGRNWEEDIWSARRLSGRASFRLESFNLGKERKSLFSESVRLCFPFSIVGSSVLPVGIWKSLAELKRLSLAAPSRLR
jgi:hypothetical protein